MFIPLVVQRECKVFAAPEAIQKKWSGLKTFVVVERFGERDGQSFYERQFYICSQCLEAQQLLADIVGHWGIENRLHWVRDVTFWRRFSATSGWQCAGELVYLTQFFHHDCPISRFSDYSPSTKSFSQPTPKSFFFFCMKPPCFLRGMQGGSNTDLRLTQRSVYTVALHLGGI